jgi:hypothetical protein
MNVRLFCAAALLMLTACATRQTAPGIYRLVDTGSARILIPPGVSDAGATSRTFDFRLSKPAGSSCRATNDALRVEPRHGSLRVTVDRSALLTHPAPWLAHWSTSLEQQGCLSPGEAASLAEQIVEAVPLNPSDAYGILHAGAAIAGYLDLVSGYRLKLVSPILREGAAPGASSLATEEVSGTGNQLTVTVKSSRDFLGYENSWYAVASRSPQPGARVVFAAAESHIGDQVTKSQQPRTNHFEFPTAAAYFRLFYFTRVSQADHNVAVLAAATRAELDRLTPAFTTDPDACARTPMQMCVALPKEVAVTTYLTVTGNDAGVEVPVESTVADALRAAGLARPVEALPTLSVRRNYHGALVPVEFDRSKSDILTLKLSGQEDLRW